MIRFLLSFACVIAGISTLASHAEEQPYAGLEGRDIATLSGDDIVALQDGAGWGFALSAELNGFPGPLHVLELADEIDLTAEQRSEIERVFARMNAEARVLGGTFITAEAELDAAFEDAVITPEGLAALVGDAEEARAALRQVHLAAHLEVTPLLTRHQRVLYARARGYDDGAGHGGHTGH